ncbi:hypothetical protein KUTeg_014513 [Tegillarca granosa]|uniref:Fibrinogen C-terminal domain-containing protein n=1 Tax=Tegillarca granosa TaxID=220873 RepID=A0ABQ9EUB2_TEGGR|nr:hypothetical protein KUTeg_014513 [Tegillarca granosa]
MKTDGGGWTVRNHRIHLLTKLNSYKLRFDMEDFKGVHKYVSYSAFSVGSENSGYVLNVEGYKGTAGDSLKYHNGRKFTTKDKDNDSRKSGNCAVIMKGACWHGSCYHSNLNGIYMKNVNNDKSMNWYHFNNNYMSLKIRGSCNVIKPSDCEDWYNEGYRRNRVYKIYPDGKTGFDVYCDMKTDGGGLTVSRCSVRLIKEKGLTEKRISIEHGRNTNMDLVKDQKNIGWEMIESIF